jgi:hypothetical protein
MLPDFPNLKDDLNRAITRVMMERTRLYQGPIGTIRRARMFEGRLNTIVRPDGSREETPLIHSSAMLNISLPELAELDLPELLMRLDAIARDMAGQQSRQFYEAMSEGVARVGNAIDAQGQKLSPKLFLKGLDRVMIAFDSDGTPQMPTLHVHPSLQTEAQSVMDQIQNNPDLQKQFQEIMTRKREEWNAGQADRVLVG